MRSYDTWVQDPTPTNMKAVLNELDPVITAEAACFGTGLVMKTKARVLAVNAIRTFDPTKATQLKSWVVAQLQPLSRYRRNLKPLRVPEAAVRRMDALNQAQTELTDTLGRNPTDIELADEVGISVKRINQLRGMSGYSLRLGPDLIHPAASRPILPILTPRDQCIFDLSVGANGKQPLPRAEIAAKLGVTPAFVSKQIAIIAELIAKENYEA
jgi:hypothetical protein